MKVMKTDIVFEFIMMFIEENFPLKIELDSRESNIEENFSSVDFPKFDKPFSPKMGHYEFIMIVLHTY